MKIIPERNRVRIATIVALLFISATVGAQLLTKTLATVRLTETEAINESEITKQFDLIESRLGTELTQQQKQEIFESKINSILINQAAERAKLIATENEIQAAITQQKQVMGLQMSDQEFQRLIVQQTGASWEQYKVQVRSRLLQEKYIVHLRPNLGSGISRPTEREIQDLYEENAQSFLSPPMVSFSHIFIDTRNMEDSDVSSARKKMEGFYRRIRNGGGQVFDQLVKESLDDASFSGGDFGYLVKGEPTALQVMGESFIVELFSSDVGELSGVLTSNVGLHIVKVTDRRSPRLLQLSDPLMPGQSLTVNQQIVQYILNQKQQQALVAALNEIVGELRDEAEIRIVDANISW